MDPLTEQEIAAVFFELGLGSDEERQSLLARLGVRGPLDAGTTNVAVPIPVPVPVPVLVIGNESSPTFIPHG